MNPSRRSFLSSAVAAALAPLIARVRPVAPEPAVPFVGREGPDHPPGPGQYQYQYQVIQMTATGPSWSWEHGVGCSGMRAGDGLA